MYGIYSNIGGILMVNVTIYTSTMDPMGIGLSIIKGYLPFLGKLQTWHVNSIRLPRAARLHTRSIEGAGASGNFSSKWPCLSGSNVKQTLPARDDSQFSTLRMAKTVDIWAFPKIPHEFHGFIVVLWCFLRQNGYIDYLWILQTQTNPYGFVWK